MGFASPWWLVGLLPWAAVLLRWLFHRPIASGVPYLQLWERQRTTRKARRVVRSIPLRVALIFAATLCALLSAARPAIGRQPQTAVVLIGEHVRTPGVLRWVDRLAEALSRESVALTVEPASETILPPRGAAPRILITDMPVDADYLIAISTTAVQPIDLVASSFAADPAEWMITLRNNSATGSATLTLSGETQTSTTLVLPTPRETRSVFIAAESIGKHATLTITGNEGQPLAAPQKLEAASVTPRLINVGTLPSAVERFRVAYAGLHPPGIDASSIFVGQTIPDTRPALFTPLTGEFETAATHIEIVPHAITRHLSMKSFDGASLRLATPPTADWQIVASVGDRPILAVREQPARQVWLGFSSDVFEQREAFVLLLADIVRWLNDAEEGPPVAEPKIVNSPLPDPEAVARDVERRLSTTQDRTSIACVAGLALLAAAGFIRR